MSRHIWETEKLTPAKVVYYWTICQRYKALDIRGLAYVMERDRMSSAWVYQIELSIKQKKWTKKVTDDKAHAIVYRLLFKPSGVRSFAAWKNLRLDVLKKRLLTEHMLKEIARFQKNIKTVFGLSVSTAQVAEFRHYNGFDTANFRAWLKKKRAKDYFIRGLGGFDLKKYFPKATVTEYFRFGPDMVSVIGYLRKHGLRWRDSGRLYRLGSPNRLLQVRKLDPDYFVRWFAPLAERYSKNTVDEVIRALRFVGQEAPAGGRTMHYHQSEHPDIVVNRYVDISDEWDEIYYRLEEEANTPKDPTQPFPSATLPVVNTPIGTIAPVQHHKELCEVANTLKNCAKQYFRSLSDDNNEALIVLRNTEGKPVALGELDILQERFYQVVGPSNSNPSKEVSTLYRGYLSYVKEHKDGRHPQQQPNN